MSRGDLAFEDWKERARQRDILEVAQELGAQLRRAGVEWVGPCPCCGGKDRFSVNMRKLVFNCRGSGGGDVIKLVEHLQGGDFIAACEFLTGEPPPNQRREESAEARRSREAAYRERVAAGQRRRTREAARSERKKSSVRDIAISIWKSAKRSGHECYLAERGVNFGIAFRSLRFVPSLEYRNLDTGAVVGSFPAVVCAVQGPDRRFRCLWRIYLEPSGREKLQVLRRGLYREDKPKLALGSSDGGAVWILPAGMNWPRGRVNVCEGVETALGVFGIQGQVEPVAAAMSTAGVENFLPPEGVDFTLIWPDGDTDKIRKVRDSDRVLPSPGLKAANALHQRLKTEGMRSAVQPTPMNGRDYLDTWNAMRARAA